MCGIFGITLKPNANILSKDVKNCLKKIAILSESRGKDSSGIAFRTLKNNKLDVIKGDVPIRVLLKSKHYKNLLEENLNSYEVDHEFAAFGHSRLVTNGTQLQEVNNQPVIKDGSLIIHNGIITNADDIWEKNKKYKREYLIDTEIIPTIMMNELENTNDILKSFHKSVFTIEGTYSVAMMFEDFNQLLLATNNSSLYYFSDNKTFLIFASEAYFLSELIDDKSIPFLSSTLQINQLTPHSVLILDFQTLSFNIYKTNRTEYSHQIKKRKSPLNINKLIIPNTQFDSEVVIDPSIYISDSNKIKYSKILEYNIEDIRNLKRCSKCLLPETFPFIVFDEHDTCNYCNNYIKDEKPKSLDDLFELVEPYRNNNQPDCLVPFSGGRDSTYTLHIIKNILKLNPISFTYDWGMVTDLARRNIARVCGKLGVENIIVSADIRWKRTNIKKNIKAWLQYPQLGMIPLFMAGDKFFFYYCNQIKIQTGIKLNIWGINDLENTDFKTGFAGIPPNFDKELNYSLSRLNQIQLFGYVIKNIIKSPSYFNQSIWDSIGSFVTRYISPKRDYFHMFDYYPWDENEINDLIKNEYKWETAIDTNSTWRIGDGTASFYNYIYCTVAGFSENDTFRSNQIREGLLDRKTALKLVEEENIPRIETIMWYLDIIGLDFETVIKSINKIKKNY